MSSEVSSIVIAVITQMGLGVVAYFKLKSVGKARADGIKSEVQKQIAELKYHTDISVQKLNGLLTSVIHSMPAPAWLKVARTDGNGNVEFYMSELNDAYASTYGIERINYLGKTDLQAGWPLNVANRFREHDLHVWATGEATTVVESIGGLPLRFRKFRVESRNGELKGIFGYAIDCGDPDNCPIHKRMPN